MNSNTADDAGRYLLVRVTDPFGVGQVVVTHLVERLFAYDVGVEFRLQSHGFVARTEHETLNSVGYDKEDCRQHPKGQVQVTYLRQRGA